MSIVKLLLTAISLSACLQTDEPSEEKRVILSHRLSIGDSKVYWSATHYGNTDEGEYPAQISSLALRERKSYGRHVTLSAGTALHDRAPLRVDEDKLKFNFSTTNKHHSCSLNKDTVLRYRTDFSMGDCPEGEHYFRKYLLAKDGVDTINVAAKIEMGGNPQRPVHLYIRHLTNNSNNAADSFEYSMMLTGENGNYTGTSGDEKYVLTPNGDDYTLALVYDGIIYSSADIGSDLKEKGYDNLDLVNTTPLNDTFITTCSNESGINRITAPEAVPELYGRRPKGGRVAEFKAGTCQHNIYGLTDPAVLDYLQNQCQPTVCESIKLFEEDPSNSTATRGSRVFGLLLNNKNYIYAYCEDTTIAFYLGKGHLSERLYATAKHKSGAMSTIWYNCTDEEKETFPATPTTSRSNVIKSGIGVRGK